jgi:hypothetical protein
MQGQQRAERTVAKRVVDPFFIDGLSSDEEKCESDGAKTTKPENKREIIHHEAQSCGRPSRRKRARCAFLDDTACGPSTSDEEESDEETLTPGFIATQPDDGAVSSAEMRGIYGRSLLSQSPVSEQSKSQASANDGEHELVRFALANGFGSLPLTSLRSALDSFVGVFGECESLTAEFCGAEFLNFILGLSKSKQVSSSPLYSAPLSPTSPSYTPTVSADPSSQ